MEWMLGVLDQEVRRATRALVPLLAAALLGAVIGYQRERVGKDAGLRTHMLVALGTAIVVVSAISAGMANDSVSRIIQGLVTGIGFIGTGAILKRATSNEIKGLTTAASLWGTAAIGIACGLGLVGIAVIATLLIWLIMAMLPQMEEPDSP